MASCTRLCPFSGHVVRYSRTRVVPNGRVTPTSKNWFRYYTAPSGGNSVPPTPAATVTTTAGTSTFIQSPVVKSAAGINQSRHSPKFETQTTELPNIASRAPLYFIVGIVGVAFWAGSLAVAANHQRQGTSIVRGTLFNVKFDTKAQELLGHDIDFTNNRWPWISGTVAHLKGRVDIEYQVRGDKAEGRVHFVAVRPVKQWITTDFTLTMPDGTCVPLGENMVLPHN